MALSLGLQDNLVWHGALAHDDVLRLMEEGYELLVLPCRRAEDGDVDGIPVVLMEAMTRGLLVITSPVGGIGELVQDGLTGLLVAERSAGEIADAVERYVFDKEVYRPIALRGKGYVDSEFNVAIEVNKLVALFSEAMKVAAFRPALDSA